MNYFAYWWTKLRLRAAGCAVRWAKKQVLLDIQNSRRATMLLENPYQRFIRFSAKREELAVRLKRCRDNRMGTRLSWVYVLTPARLLFPERRRISPFTTGGWRWSAIRTATGAVSQNRSGRRTTGACKMAAGLSVPCIFPGTADYSVLKPIWQISKLPSDGSVKAYEPDNHHFKADGAAAEYRR